MSEQSQLDESATMADLRDRYETERAAREAAEATVASSADLAKENVFLKAGVNLDEPLGRLMFDGYKGDLDVDKVKEFAAGIAPASSGPSAAQQQEQREREALVGEAPPPPTEETPDPITEGFDHFHERLAKGASREAASAEVYDRLITAAVNGDERAIYDPARWREQQAANAS